MKGKVTRKFQVTIPKEIREFLGIDVGDTVVWEIREDNVIVKKAERAEDIEELRGLWKSHPLIKGFQTA